MKIINALALASFLVLAGCQSSQDKYDIASEKASKKVKILDSKEAADIQMPKDGKLEEVTIPKGTKMPDGTITKEDQKIKAFTAPAGKNEKWSTQLDSKSK